MVDFEGRVVVLSLRIAQGLFAIIVLALSCYVSHWWNQFWHHNSPSQVNFFIFTSIWTILALIYLILVPWRFSETRAHHKFAILAAEAVTMIFWFAGFIAMAVFLGDRVCYGSVCSAAKAATVFGAFEWVFFCVTTVMAVMHVMRTRDRTLDNGKANKNLDVHDTV